MFLDLLKSRRFAPLFWTQLLSAFNDNFVRNMLAMLILFKLGATQAGPLITLAVGIFILPSIFLSALGGQIADAHDKALIARRLKFGEIFVQMIAAAGFWFASITLLYTALFGLGVIAALFGPIKYGILPDHLKTKELPAGNALVEGATFAAILLGLIVGAYAAAQPSTSLNVILQLMVVALACWLCSRYIPSTGAASPGLKIEANIFASTWHMVRDLRTQKNLWNGGLAVSWFWLTGAVALSLVPVIIKERVGGGIDTTTIVNAIFAIGIAVGSIVAAIIAHGRIILLPVPIAAFLMAAFLIDLGFATAALPVAGQQIALSEFFSSAQGIRIIIDVAGVSAAGGLFVVPAFAAVQAWAGEDRRARVVAAVNIITSIFIVAGAAATALFQAVGISEPLLLILLGLLNLAAGVFFFRILPGNFAADFLNMIFRLVFRLEVRGMEHLENAPEKCVIALNHVSFLDAPVILSLLQRKPVFAIDWQIAQAWWVKPFLGIAKCFPMDPSKPLSTRGLINEVKEGEHLVIFPEGRLTVTGSLMKVYDGAAMIADKADAVVIPVRLEGLERTYFSRVPDQYVRRSFFPKVRVTILPPRKLEIDDELRGRKRRQAASAALYGVMANLIYETSDIDKTLTNALTQSITRVGKSKPLVEDPLTGRLSGRKVQIGAAVLARKIMEITGPGETVGLMLPNAGGAAVTFFAVQAAGRVAAMLNYTAGAANMKSACKAAGVKTVLTSQAFIEKAKLGPISEALAEDVKLIYLEDVRETISGRDKLRGFIDAGKMLHARDAKDPAVILFTSGSEGTPKGVVLSHRNFVANIAQIFARFDITPADIIFNVLPIFHSFGLTGGMLLPMLSGMKCFLYPSPLHYRQIPELIYATNATVLFGTDTFLSGYARSANAYDLRSLRYIVAGAEAVKDTTRQTYSEKFGLRILEGYGVTETAPVLAVNTPMFNRSGTVGRFLPGIEPKLEPVPGIEEGGRLSVRGDNVMTGYLRAENPGMLEETPGGWHDTGDIVDIDGDGFVRIKGRAKRFAKIAGEMVSLAAVEQICAGLWPDHPVAVAALPDARKGERLVLVTTNKDADRAQVQEHMRKAGTPELMMPAEVRILPELPLLGSGKIDHVALGKALSVSQTQTTSENA